MPTGDEDDAGDSTIDEHLDVLVLARSPRCLGAQQGSVPAGGQQLLDLLGESREDRVPQLRNDQPDQPSRALPQGYGALVAEQVERDQHLASGDIGDVRLPVENS